MVSPSSQPAFIHVDGVSRRFGTRTAVSRVSFSVRAGTICGLVGSDGAGKTTLLRMVGAMTRPSEGRILIDGLDTAAHRNRMKDLIGYMPQRFGLYEDLTVGENMTFFMDIFGITGRERKRRRELYLGFSNLVPFIERRARDLSGGMKQKLGLACVLIHQPRVLILDEPTNGVDPVSRQEFWDLLLQMKGEGMTILVSTSYLDEGEKCDQLILMHRARMLAAGTPEVIQSRYPDLEEAMIARILEGEKAPAHEQPEA
jgi:ABC-2 type transport system ATP-binding protein